MDLATIRPGHRDVLVRVVRRWTAPSTIVMAMAAGPWSSFAIGGETSPATTQAPTASQGRPNSPKAQVASSSTETKGGDRVLDPATVARSAVKPTEHPETDPIARALRVVADCKQKYKTVQDYTCTFFKRERVDGRLYTTHVMNMKARTNPSSLYFKFIQPNAGREAIFVHGHNDNKIVAHDIGLARVVAGTMHLDPKGGMAMEENRHPVTEAGLGSMIELVKGRWDTELIAGESTVLFHPNATVGDRPCLMVESIHPKPGPQFLFHKVKFYVDRELGLPIRFEAYDWSKHPGAEPELMEEYTYMNLRVNVGLKDRDFDPNNKQYSYGRF